MDFLRHKFLPCFSKILLIHFLPFRISLSTNYLLSCLSNILLKLFYSSSSLEKLCSLSFKNFFKTMKTKKMKHSRSNPEETPRRMFLEENQEKALRRSNPLIPPSHIFNLSLWTFSQVPCD